MLQTQHDVCSTGFPATGHNEAFTAPSTLYKTLHVTLLPRSKHPGSGFRHEPQALPHKVLPLFFKIFLLSTRLKSIHNRTEPPKCHSISFTPPTPRLVSGRRILATRASSLYNIHFSPTKMGRYIGRSKFKASCNAANAISRSWRYYDCLRSHLHPTYRIEDSGIVIY